MTKSYIWKCEWCIISKPQNPQIVILHKKYNIFGVVFLHVNRTHHYLYLGFLIFFETFFLKFWKKLRLGQATKIHTRWKAGWTDNVSSKTVRASHSTTFVPTKSPLTCCFHQLPRGVWVSQSAPESAMVVSSSTTNELSFPSWRTSQKHVA
jgi:hypothetical protein